MSPLPGRTDAHSERAPITSVARRALHGGG